MTQFEKKYCIKVNKVITSFLKALLQNVADFITHWWKIIPNAVGIQGELLTIKKTHEILMEDCISFKMQFFRHRAYSVCFFFSTEQILRMVSILFMILALTGISASIIYTVKYIKNPWSASHSYICLWGGIIFVMGGLIIHTIIGDAKFFGKKCCVPSAPVMYHKESTSDDIVRLRLLWHVEELQKICGKWGIRVLDKLKTMDVPTKWKGLLKDHLCSGYDPSHFWKMSSEL